MTWTPKTLGERLAEEQEMARSRTPDTPKPPAPTPASAETLEQLRAKIDKAQKELSAMCERQWAGKAAIDWRIPADPMRDSDLLISDGLMAGADALRRLHAASSASFSSQPSAVPAVNVNQHPAPATDESRHPSVPNGEDSGQSAQTILDRWTTSGLPSVAAFNHAVDVANALHRRLQSTEQEMVNRAVEVEQAIARAEAAEQKVRDLEQEKGTR